MILGEARWLFDCPTCGKAKRNGITYFLIVFTAAGVSFLTLVIYVLLGVNFTNIPSDALARFSQFPMVFGAAAYLMFSLWKFDDLVCHCGEAKMEAKQ